jgi:N-acetylglucosamine kinase
MSLILGLDSGGTKTFLAIADRDGQVTSLRRGQGLDPSTGGDWALALKSLLESHAQDLDASVLGLPFHDEVKQYSDEQTSIAKALIPGNTLVQNDVRIAFDGALAGKPGVLALAGTGSMIWASLNGPSDPHIRVGGWGDAFGDEGSAYWIGREALALVSQHLDGRATAAEFCNRMLAVVAIEPGDLIGWCYALENRRLAFAELARTVSLLAEAGNADARVILHAEADHLAAHIKAAWRQTGADEPLRWTYAGGVLSSAIVRDRIAAQVGLEPVAPRLPPVGGALLRAAENAGWAVDEAWLDRLSASLNTLIYHDDHQQKGE